MGFDDDTLLLFAELGEADKQTIIQEDFASLFGDDESSSAEIKGLDDFSDLFGDLETEAIPTKGDDDLSGFLDSMGDVTVSQVSEIAPSLSPEPQEMLSGPISLDFDELFSEATPSPPVSKADLNLDTIFEMEGLPAPETATAGADLEHLFDEIALPADVPPPPTALGGMDDLLSDLGFGARDDLTEVTAPIAPLPEDLSDLFGEEMNAALELPTEAPSLPVVVPIAESPLDLAGMFDEDLDAVLAETGLNDTDRGTDAITMDSELAMMLTDVPSAIAAPYHRPSIDTSSHTIGEDLAAVLEDDLSGNLSGGEVAGPPSLVSAPTPVELDDLTGIDFDDLVVQGEQEEGDPAYYATLEELAQTILQPVQAPRLLDVEALIALIERPVTRVVVESPPAVIAPMEPEAPPQEVDKEDDFGDLLDLLQETDRTMGGSPVVTASANAANVRRPTKGVQVFEQTMRVPIKQLDSLTNLIGELVVNRNSLEQGQERLHQFLDNLMNQVQKLNEIGARMHDLYERSLLESSLLASRSRTQAQSVGVGYGSASHRDVTNSAYTNTEEYDPLEMDRFTGFHLLSQEMIELIVRVRESSSDIQFLVDDTENVSRNLRQVTTQIQEGLNKSRMVPFAHAADRLPRAVRDISIKLNKKAELQVEGRDAMIDKMIMEKLYDPLTHLVNNAITHGIETPAEREAKGKAPTGRITIRAFLQGNQTVIAISDDGAGLDPRRIKAKAIERKLISPTDASRLSKQEIFDFIFRAGFSTRDQADAYAGRGVGMDVVNTALTAIRGGISIDSTLDQGTTFTIRLPLTLSICKALCCISDHARIAFPMDGVEDMQDIDNRDVQMREDGTRFIHWRDQLLPCLSLSRLLNYNRHLGRVGLYGGHKEADKTSVVILRGTNTVLAIQVDQVIGEQEIVIKQIEGPIPKPAGIAGATVLGDGSIMPIADVLELLEIALGTRRADAGGNWQQQASLPSIPTAQAEPMVLIVDDSITVRELLSMSFNKAGYRVEQARDGLEAWEKLKSGLPCDLVFCDIEMPRMDGLDLLGRIQKDEELSRIPVAMLTSRGADRHRQVAAQLGASAYFTKPYLEEALIDAAEQMMHGDVLLANSTRPPGISRQTYSSDTPSSGAIVQDSPPITGILKPKADSHVLIIDDSVTVRELLSMTFQNAGYQVEKARDGMDALEKLRSGHFDLAFCDIEMPRLDGLELLTKVQEMPELQNIPIAMLTSRGAERHRKIAAERGAKAYFTKPYMEDVLLEAASQLIAGRSLLNADGSVAS